MAYHLHRQIREKVETALGNLATSGARVYSNRIQPMADANLPGLRIFADEDGATVGTIHAPHLLERELRLSVECCAKVATSLDDTLDLMSQEVEVALSAGITIGSTHLDCIYTGMSFDDEQSDKPVGIKRLNFSVTYSCMSNAPDTLS